MPTDPLDALRRADARFCRLREDYKRASKAREQAIISAVERGVTVAEVARALGISHEYPRRVVRRAGL